MADYTYDDAKRDAEARMVNIAGGVDKGVSAVQSAWGSLKAGVKSVAEEVPTYVGAAGDMVADGAKAVGEFGVKVGKGVEAGAMRNVATLDLITQPARDAVAYGAKAAAGAAVDGAKTVASGYVEYGTKAVNTVEGFGTGVANGLDNMDSAVKGWLANKLNASVAQNNDRVEQRTTETTQNQQNRIKDAEALCAGIQGVGSEYAQTGPER